MRLQLHDAPRRIAPACGLVSGLAGLVAAYVSQRGSLSPKAMINLADTDPLAGYVRRSDPGFPLVTSVQHYDGVYYYAIARDPLATGRPHTLIDQATYRYGHPLHGWLAALLSAGHPGAIPLALFALSLLGLGTAGWLASRLAADLGGKPWLGLLVAASPGLLYSVTVSTTEPVGAALVLGSLLCWHRGRLGAAGLLMTLGCLDKEQYVAVPVGLAIWEAVRLVRDRRPPPRVGQRFLALVLAPVPLALWYAYLRIHLHHWPFDYQPGNFGWPVLGWLETFDDAHALALGSFEQSEIGTVTMPALVALAVLLLGASVRALWLRSNPMHLPLVLLAVITSCQGWRTLLYPHELVRTPAVAVLLALLVLLTPGRAPTPPSSSGDKLGRVARNKSPLTAVSRHSTVSGGVAT